MGFEQHLIDNFHKHIFNFHKKKVQKVSESPQLSFMVKVRFIRNILQALYWAFERLLLEQLIVPLPNFDYVFLVRKKKTKTNSETLNTVFLMQ